MPTGPRSGAPSEPEIRFPPAAKLWYACAQSSVETPCLKAPSVIAGLVDTGVRTPMLVMSREILLVPVFKPTAAKTALSETVSADPRSRVPEYELSKLLTVNISPSSPGTSKTRLRDSQTEPRP